MVNIGGAGREARPSYASLRRAREFQSAGLGRAQLLLHWIVSKLRVRDPRGRVAPDLTDRITRPPLTPSRGQPSRTAGSGHSGASSGVIRTAFRRTALAVAAFCRLAYLYVERLAGHVPRVCVHRKRPM